MKRKLSKRRIPNLSLITGLIFTFIIFSLFGVILISSTNNIREMDFLVRSLVLNAALSQSEEQDRELFERFNSLMLSDSFTAWSASYNDRDSIVFSPDVMQRDELLNRLEILSLFITRHENHLLRSQMVLFITFLGLLIILAILFIFSELDQIRKLEREKQLRYADQKLLDVLESERNRIALELHDDVAQKMAVISRHFHSSEEEVHSDLLKRYNQDVIQSIRGMAQNLRSPETETLSFQDQLEMLFSDFRSISRIRLQVDFMGVKALNITQDVMLHLYRIIQELLTNARKHSSAGNVQIRLLYVHPVFRIQYRDDGIGFSWNEIRRGLGLNSIQYRINILQGEIEMRDEPGTSLHILIPMRL